MRFKSMRDLNLAPFLHSKFAAGKRGGKSLFVQKTFGNKARKKLVNFGRKQTETEQLCLHLPVRSLLIGAVPASPGKSLRRADSLSGFVCAMG